MIKIYIKNIASMLLFTVLLLWTACADEETPECTVKNYIIIENSSAYHIEKVIIHNDRDYSGTDPFCVDLEPGGTSETYEINDSPPFYVTFIRKATSSSDIDIAVTTQEPLEFEACTDYRLLLLEEDFFLEIDY